uniref:FecCD family ABC transporter permease n=1 Tax=Komagataeibacter xylinus TaxID=28448 RepID=UPI000662C363|nr:iron ABC transporter permease [Komagataeibacter xylinus]
MKYFPLLVAVILFCFLGIGEISLGTAPLSWAMVLHGLQAGPFSHDIPARIIWLLRVPRFFMAFMTGAILAAAGALLQGATRNPLADPFLFGLSSGAAAGAVAVIIFLGDMFGIWTTALGATVGAALSTLILLFLVVLPRKPLTTDRMILCGLTVSFLFSTLTSLMILWGDRNAAQSILFWTMGSFSAARWSALPVVALGLICISVYGWKYRTDLDALLAGEETATSLGIHITRLRISTLLVCAFSCALTVALCGPIGFIGLIVPHLVRFRKHISLQRIFFPSLVAGGLLMVLADMLSRGVLASQEIPVGIIVGFLGACFMIVLVNSKER